MEDKVLMSIKTNHADRIFDGIKKYEFRRRSIKEKNLNKKIFIYSSGALKAIVGYIIFDEIIKGDISSISSLNNDKNTNILSYFEGLDVCYALKVKKAVRFEKPIYFKGIKEKDKTFTVPQYYRYVKSNEYIYKYLN